MASSRQHNCTFVRQRKAFIEAEPDHYGVTGWSGQHRSRRKEKLVYPLSLPRDSEQLLQGLEESTFLLSSEKSESKGLTGMLWLTWICSMLTDRV